MCVVSNVHDYMRDRTWPPVIPWQPGTAPTINPNTVPWDPNSPGTSPLAPVPPDNRIVWTRDTFEQFKQILEKLAELDGKLNQAECADPAKAAWMQEIERRLSLLEETQEKP